MKKLNERIKEKMNGLYYGNRVILPFRAHVVKAIVENDIIMDFSNTKKGAEYFIREDFTEIYFHDYKNLQEVMTKYETIKLVCVEVNDDIFNFENHVKVCLHLKEKHSLIIEEPGEDILLFE